MKRATLLVLPLLLAMAIPADALGDLAPPGDYVEQCTEAKACTVGEEARSCDSSVRETDKCKKALAKDGWAYKCRTYGGSAWTEIWCRAKKAKR